MWGSDLDSPIENKVSFNDFVLVNSNPTKTIIIIIKQGRNMWISMNCKEPSQYLSMRVSNDREQGILSTVSPSKKLTKISQSTKKNWNRDSSLTNRKI